MDVLDVSYVTVFRDETFSVYIRSVIKRFQSANFMIKKLKSIKKSNLVLLVLVLLNVVAFTVVSSGIKHKTQTTETIASNNDNNTYFKSGVNVLDWSYTLLRYFKR
jgi:hypothetical protein